MNRNTISDFLLMVSVAGEDECWNWSSPDKIKGYGRFSMDGKRQMAHRISYTLFISEIPDGMSVLHHCDNPSCVNPKHLFIGTQKDNVQDMLSKQRANRPCGERQHLSRLSGDDVIRIREMYSGGSISQKDLGALFGVSQTSIYNIVNRRTWKHIP